jgi:hypothetical protein
MVAAALGEEPRHVESLLAQRSIPVYGLRPVSCDIQPAIQSKAPRPAVAQRLLDALVSPASPLVVAEQTPVIGPFADTVFPGGPGAMAPFIGGPIGGGPPLGPPVTPPVVIPPGSPAPEPATWAMLFLGFAGVGSALRVRQRRLNMVKSQ